MILVLGGGVTGLAAGTALQAAGAEFLVLEKEAEPGGWCRSFSSGGYAFDLSGHFLHLSDPAAKSFILDVPGVPWQKVERDARVWLREVLTPYPFQVHLKGHDPAFVRRCLADFASERIRDAISGEGTPGNLAEWLIRRFGKAMCEAFFYPYNRKMWRAPLSKLGHEWTGWSVPVPRFEDLLEGASGGIHKGMGYNAEFYYPRRGGIGSLARALGRGIGSRLRTGVEIERIDLRRKVAYASGGESFPFRSAVSTVPLPRMAAFSGGIPSRARRAANSLSWVKVLAINIGVRNPGMAPGHWVYVPERSYPFFRVGFLSNVSRSAAPPGRVSMFVEKSFPSSARVNVTLEVEAALRGLRKMGVLSEGSRIEELHPVMLDPAYVRFDGARKGAVSLLAREFGRHGVFPAGRYGAWDYYGMEKSMADGIRAAREAVRAARMR
ncbi:MAG: FAD-dependent oxidoreductase [Deltaproteobacteria bacterium]|nr:FAD-dependent oxidoreductase [Deltaproteobacteria bacterium]